MITTVTLNTSIDKAYYLEDENKTYCVQRVSKCINSAGGKGLNVARCIKLCEKEVEATGFIGGFNGKYLKDLLNKDGIKEQFVEVDGETRSCINIIDSNKKSTEYLEPGFILTKEDETKFINVFKDIISKSDVITFSGSVPKGISKDIYGQLIDICNAQNKKTILDSSGDLLLNALEHKPTLVKPNQEELEAVLNIRIDNNGDLLKAAKMLLAYGIKYVVISLGDKGAFICDEKQAYIARVKDVKAINTVGSGDCMVGALAIALKEGKDIKDMLAYGVAVGSANATNEKTGFFELETVNKFLNNIEIQIVKGD